MKLSRKRKPLGPRQRAAYVKPFKAELEAAKKKVAEQTAATEAAQKRIDRLAAPALLRKATGTDTSLTTTLELSGYGIKVGTPAEVRATRKALVSGELAIQIGGGSPKLPSLARRFRRMGKAEQRKLRALDKRIREARQAREELIEAAFGAGDVMGIEQLADLIIAIAKAKHARPGYIDTYAINRAESSLAEALKHDGTGTCPCGKCASARHWADVEKQNKAAQIKRQKAEAARLRKLGTRDFTCPHCGHENAAAQVDEDESYREGRYVVEKFVQCEECHEGTALEDLDLAAAEVAKAEAPSPGQEAMQLVA